MKSKKVYSAEQKAEIMREHLEDNIPIGDLAEKYKITPNVLYTWKKLLLEQASSTLTRKSIKSKEKRISAEAKENAELKALLAKREMLIAELVTENFELKKNTGGGTSTKNGWNRKSGMK
jgi:transposase-like protein